MENYYLVLYPDLVYHIWSRKPDPKEFQEGTRFWEVSYKTQIWEIMEWVLCGFIRHNFKEFSLKLEGEKNDRS